MGTRGFVGFITPNGVLKGQYNHFDSYWSGIGANIVEFIRENLKYQEQITEVGEQVENLHVIPCEDSDEPVSKEVAKILKKRNWKLSGKIKEMFGKERHKHPYVLLRECQGNIQKILESGCIIDGTDFPYDSLDCEYGYVLNFQTNEIELYRGLQKKKHCKGRFAKRGCKPDEYGYYPIALVKTYPFKKIPKKWFKDLQ